MTRLHLDNGTVWPSLSAGDGAADERAAIVAYLRGMITDTSYIEHDIALSDAADAIERGDKLDAASCYLHYSGRPLVEAVGETAEQAGQIDMFGGECDGMCGL